MTIAEPLLEILRKATCRQRLNGCTGLKSPLVSEPTTVLGNNWELFRLFRQLVDHEQPPPDILRQVEQSLELLSNAEPDWPILECDDDPAERASTACSDVSSCRAKLFQAYCMSFLAILRYFHRHGSWEKCLVARAVAGFNLTYTYALEHPVPEYSDVGRTSAGLQLSPAISSLIEICSEVDSPGFWILCELVQHCDIQRPAYAAFGKASVPVLLADSCMGASGEPIRGHSARLVVELYENGPAILTPDPLWAGLTVLNTDTGQSFVRSLQTVWKVFCKSNSRYRGQWRLEPFTDDEGLFLSSLSGRSMEASLAIALLEASTPRKAETHSANIDPRVAVMAVLECQPDRGFGDLELRPLPRVDAKLREACRRSQLSRIIVAPDQKSFAPFIEVFWGDHLIIEEAANIRELRRKVSRIGGELAKFRFVTNREWHKRWNNDDGDDSSIATGRFVADRRIQLLSRSTGDPLKYVAARHTRVSNTSHQRSTDTLIHAWEDWSIDGLMEEIARPATSRLFVVCEAGYGKTTFLKFIESSIGDHDQSRTAFYIEVSDLPEDPQDIIASCLIKRITHFGLTPNRPNDLAEELHRHREQGTLILLLDALDQSARPECLNRLLRSESWKHCPIVVTGRPFSVIENRNLFEGNRWVFAALDQFTPEQLKLVLGERYKYLPYECLDIARIPRFAEAILRIPQNELADVLSPSEVYFSSLRWMLQEGIEKQNTTADVEWPEDVKSSRSNSLTRTPGNRVKEALELLSAIAFEMTSQLMAVTSLSHDGLPMTIRRRPNFDKVKENQIDAFKLKVFTRIRNNPRAILKYSGSDRKAWREFCSDLESLARINVALRHSLIEYGSDEEIEFQNRSLQEFLCAYWLSKYATEEDSRTIYDWIYLPMFQQTHDYYWVWMFLCEMGEGCRTPDVWTASISNLFRRGDGQTWCPNRKDGRGTKRSTEMMFRCHSRLLYHAGEGLESAQQVLSDYYFEFEQCVLNSSETRNTAIALCNSFLTIPGGEFQMGSSPDQQGMPKSHKATCEADLVDARIALTNRDLDQWFDSWVSRPRSDSWAPIQLDGTPRVRDRQLKYWKQLITDAVQNDGLAHIERELYPRDERRHNHAVQTYQIGRVEVFNAWYRLFDPSHGITWPSDVQYSLRLSDNVSEEDRLAASAVCYGNEFTSTFRTRQDDDIFPVYLTSFYDAVMFARWLRWDGQSCRIPTEAEWEYAAKFGVDPDLPYWWGRTPDSEKCIYDNIRNGVMPPHPSRANPQTKRIDPLGLGVMDMLGNIWEWCQDVYEVMHTGSRLSPNDAFSRRVLRGGAADKSPAFVRMARRNSGEPGAAGQKIGIRLARDV